MTSEKITFKNRLKKIKNNELINLRFLYLRIVF